MGWKDDPVVGKGRPAIDIRPGGGVPKLLAASANPYSAGLYPLGRIFTVGDHATLRETNVLTGVEKRIYSPRVSPVSISRPDRVEIQPRRDRHRFDGQHPESRQSQLRCALAVRG